MTTVCVLSKDGKPLDPTTRCGHVRILLKEKKARVVERVPFTIQLLYDVANSNVTQEYVLGIDPGRTNIGLSVVDSSGEPVFQAEVITRNKDIPKLMRNRKNFRQQHRKHTRRDKRRRRARAAGTVKTSEFERILPGCEKPIVCHDIKNKESRFCYRKRPEGWLTPTANQLLQTHVNAVQKVQKMLPISRVVLEINRFAFMALDNPRVQKWQFQKGPLYKTGGLHAAVSEQQNGHCIFCDNAIAHYHHVVPRHLGGSDTIGNIAGLCNEHHDNVHKSSEWVAKLAKKKAGLNKKYGALSVLNQIIPKLTDELSTMLPTYATTGRDTKAFREIYGIEKTHANDAYSIACSILTSVKGVHTPDVTPHLIMQFRRHDRQACHQEMLDRKYLLDKKVVAKNRHKATEQKDTDSLEEYVAKGGRTDNLSVKKHKRTCKRINRWMPRSLLLVSGIPKVMCSSQGIYKGQPSYYKFPDGTKDNASHCKILKKNQGLVFVS